MYHVSAQGVDERMINVHYYYYYLPFYQHSSTWQCRIHSPTLWLSKPWCSWQHTLENFISQTSKSCYCQLLQIRSVQKYLSTEATVKLLTSLCHAPSTAVLSCTIHYSSHLSGLPASSVSSLQCIQNCAAHLLLKKRRRKLTISPLCFQLLHWLPAPQRIQYKINTLCYKCVMHAALSYISLRLSSTFHTLP